MCPIESRRSEDSAADEGGLGLARPVASWTLVDLAVGGTTPWVDWPPPSETRSVFVSLVEHQKMCARFRLRSPISKTPQPS